jgi:RNA polymerase sigma-70 factor (ECF subfamily)
MTTDEQEPPQQMEEWIRAARAGSTAALGQLLDSCRNYLLLVANERLEPETRARYEAIDLVQQTFLEAHRDFGLFHGHTEAELLAWLRCILVNTLSNWARDLQAEKREVRREVSLEMVLHTLREEALTTGDPHPVAGLIAEEEQRRVMQALDRLPEDYRQVLQLRHQGGLSFAAIGAAMGRSAEAARKLWGRAVEQLHNLLGRSDESP